MMESTARALYDRALAPPTAEQARHAAELRATADELARGNVAPAGADEFWVETIARLRERLRTDDPREFLRWPEAGPALGQPNGRAALAEYRHLRGLPDWRPRWSPALDVGTVGRPVRFILAPRTTPVTVQHVYHLAVFEAATGRRAEGVPLIVEFGGGFGDTCRLVHKLGFAGRYLIFDLPEMLAIQRYFLRSNGVADVFPVAEFDRRESGVFQCSDLAEIPGGLGGAMLIATWSLSECPVALREAFLSRVDAAAWHLVAYQPVAAGVDNRAYFEQWAARRAGRSDFTRIAIAHSTSHYLIGRPTGS